MHRAVNWSARHWLLFGENLLRSKFFKHSKMKFSEFHLTLIVEVVDPKHRDLSSRGHPLGSHHKTDALGYSAASIRLRLFEFV